MVKVTTTQVAGVATMIPIMAAQDVALLEVVAGIIHQEVATLTIRVVAVEALHPAIKEIAVTEVAITISLALEMMIPIEQSAMIHPRLAIAVRHPMIPVASGLA